MTLQSLAQILASGLLMGLIYALIAAGLSLIFGLMDVVNFAHGEFLMLAMYATFGIVVATALDPVLAMPLVAASGDRFTGSPPGWELHPHRLRVVRNPSDIASAIDPPNSLV